MSKVKRKQSNKQTLQVMKEVLDGKVKLHKIKSIQLELRNDEFTANDTIKNSFTEWLVEAKSFQNNVQEYVQVNIKQMVRELANKTEEELYRIGKADLISHISEEIVYLIKEGGLRWSSVYIRRCLDERFKSQYRRENALQRIAKKKGIPQDTDKTVSELEESLNRKPAASGWGTEYVVKQTLECKDKEELKAFFNVLGHYTQLVKAGGLNSNIDVKIPVIITAMPNKQDVIIKIDIEECKKLILPKPKPKVKKAKPQSAEKILGDVVNKALGDLVTYKKQE